MGFRVLGLFRGLGGLGLQGFRGLGFKDVGLGVGFFLESSLGLRVQRFGFRDSGLRQFVGFPDLPVSRTGTYLDFRIVFGILP